MTEYVVLAKKDGAWVQYEDVVRASSSRSALRGFLNGRTSNGEFVAIPARSWRPVTVQVETKTALKFS